jgi:Ni,Fe-hydrogenase III small subunit
MLSSEAARHYVVVNVTCGGCGSKIEIILIGTTVFSVLGEHHGISLNIVFIETTW